MQFRLKRRRTECKGTDTLLWLPDYFSIAYLSRFAPHFHSVVSGGLG
jgi:hypothetical protein